MSEPAPRTGRLRSLYSVWLRHMWVYRQTLGANIIGQLIQPMINFVAMAFGIGRHLKGFEGVSYPMFVASGVIGGASMSTGVAECTYNTFVRLVYARTHDAMLATQLTVREVYAAELIFAATKAVIVTICLMAVITLCGVPLNLWCGLVPLVGLANGYLFAAFGMLVCGYVKVIDSFNIFMGAIIMPMFFFSGTIFPIKRIHPAIDIASHLLPLTHAVQVVRALYRGGIAMETLGHLGAMLIFSLAFHVLAIRRMRKRVIL